MQGASPLASPGLNPRGTYRTCQADSRSGALPLAGRGWWRSGTPATGWGAALAPLSASDHFTVKAKESVYLWTVPAAKERGDRGRGTSAFEMVLSPGAGITSAVGGQGEQVPSGNRANRRPSERHLTRPALLFPFPPAQCGRDHPAPCAFPQHQGRKEWWSGHG